MEKGGDVLGGYREKRLRCSGGCGEQGAAVLLLHPSAGDGCSSALLIAGLKEVVF